MPYAERLRLHEAAWRTDHLFSAKSELHALLSPVKLYGEHSSLGGGVLKHTDLMRRITGGEVSRISVASVSRRLRC